MSCRQSSTYPQEEVLAGLLCVETRPVSNSRAALSGGMLPACLRSMAAMLAQRQECGYNPSRSEESPPGGLRTRFEGTLQFGCPDNPRGSILLFHCHRCTHHKETTLSIARLHMTNHLPISNPEASGLWLWVVDDLTSGVLHEDLPGETGEEARVVMPRNPVV